MLVFLITVLIVTILLVLDRIYPRIKEPIKYTNLDWEVIRGTYSGSYRGRIYSVVKNKVKVVYLSRRFDSRSAVETFIKKIYSAMRIEYGLVDEQPCINTRWFNKPLK